MDTVNEEAAAPAVAEIGVYAVSVVRVVDGEVKLLLETVPAKSEAEAVGAMMLSLKSEAGMGSAVVGFEARFIYWLDSLIETNNVRYDLDREREAHDRTALGTRNAFKEWGKTHPTWKDRAQAMALELGFDLKSHGKTRGK